MQACLTISFHDKVGVHKMHQPEKGRMSVFLIVERMRQTGTPSDFKKMPYKVAAHGSLSREQFVGPTEQYIRYNVSPSFLFCLSSPPLLHHWSVPLPCIYEC